MIRQILCRKCAGDSDRLNRNWNEQDCLTYPVRTFRWICLFKPAVCDACGGDVDGIAGALTLLRSGEEYRDWEPDYGVTLPEEAVKMFDKLTI